MAKVIGITGLIASGKSTLTNYLKEKGYRVFDADYSVKELYNNIAFLDGLKDIFPTAFIDGNFNKSILSKIVFSSPAEKKKLENIIHPIIEKKCDEFIKDNMDESLIFLDIPLLFEVNWDRKCNEVVLVVVNKEIQKERYIGRGGKPELFEKIIENQGNIEEKISKSTYVLENNSDINDFYRKIDDTLYKLNHIF